MSGVGCLVSVVWYPVVWYPVVWYPVSGILCLVTDVWCLVCYPMSGVCCLLSVYPMSGAVCYCAILARLWSGELMPAEARARLAILATPQSTYCVIV